MLYLAGAQIDVSVAFQGIQSSMVNLEVLNIAENRISKQHLPAICEYLYHLTDILTYFDTCILPDP